MRVERVGDVLWCHQLINICQDSNNPCFHFRYHGVIVAFIICLQVWYQQKQNETLEQVA